MTRQLLTCAESVEDRVSHWNCQPIRKFGLWKSPSNDAEPVDKRLSERIKVAVSGSTPVSPENATWARYGRWGSFTSECQETVHVMESAANLVVTTPAIRKSAALMVSVVHAHRPSAPTRAATSKE